MGPIDLAGLEDAHGDAELLWAVLEDTTRMRRAEVGAITDAALAWSPAPGTHSIGAVLMHIVDAEAYWIHEVVGGSRRTPEERALHQTDDTDQWNERWAAAPDLDHEALLALHDTVRARSRQVVAGLDGQATFPLGDRSVTLRWVLKHVATHEAYHYGQMELLRQMHERMTP